MPHDCTLSMGKSVSIPFVFFVGSQISDILLFCNFLIDYWLHRVFSLDAVPENVLDEIFQPVSIN